MKKSIVIPELPSDELKDMPQLKAFLFSIQKILRDKQTDDYSAVDKTSTDLTTLSGSVTSFISAVDKTSTDLTTLSGSVTSFITDNKATQAQAEAGTDDTKIITPHTLREGLRASGDAPVYACRAWVNFNGTLSSGDLRRANGNVSSITDRTTGTWSINFTTPMEDTNYVVVAMSRGYDSSDGSTENMAESFHYARTTSQVTIVNGYNGTLCDSLIVQVAVFR